MIRVQYAVALCALWSVDAAAFSLRIHMLSGARIADELAASSAGKTCQIQIGGWNKAGGPDLRANVTGGTEPLTLDLAGDVCALITNAATRQYFISGTVAPDVFPGLFENTDPTHALYWNTSWQVEVLWQNAATPEERAFVLGWIVHFAGDMNAHGLANMHAGGVWGTDPAGSVPNTEWKHTIAEVYYAKKFFKFLAGFDNTLKFPESFVKKMFFNPESPIYKQYDYIYNALPIGATARRTHAMFRALFLLWRQASGEARKFQGHLAYYQNAGVANNVATSKLADLLGYQFALSAESFWKAKSKSAKAAIDRWYTAAVREAQAKVADESCVFKGTGKYPAAADVTSEESTRMRDAYRGVLDKIRTTAAGTYLMDDPPSDGKYAEGGLKGQLDAYRYLLEGVVYAFQPSFEPQRLEDLPIVGPAIGRLKAKGGVALSMVQALEEIRRDIAYRINTPSRIVSEKIWEIIEVGLEQLALFLSNRNESDFETLVANRLASIYIPRGVTSLDIQKSQFGLARDNPGSWINWPIFRNSVTAAALMMMKMKERIEAPPMIEREERALTRHGRQRPVRAPRTPPPRGEEQSPTFGIASGDFGCSQLCTSVFREFAAHFMPDAGMYYLNSLIKDALPDHCPLSFTEFRRSATFNEHFSGKRIDPTNTFQATGAPFTCFAQASAFSARCPTLKDSANNDTQDIYRVKAIADVRDGAAPTNAPVLGALVPFFAQAPNEWQYKSPQNPRVPNVYVVPARSGIREFVRDGAPTLGSTPKVPLCYQALAVDSSTLAPNVPDLLARSVDPQSRVPFDVVAYSGIAAWRVSTVMGEIASGVEAKVKDLMRPACTMVTEFVAKAVSEILEGAKGTACRLACSTAAIRSGNTYGPAYDACVSTRCQCPPEGGCDCILGARSACEAWKPVNRVRCP